MLREKGKSFARKKECNGDQGLKVRSGALMSGIEMKITV